jgi:hypothetical protein
MNRGSRRVMAGLLPGVLLLSVQSLGRPSSRAAGQPARPEPVKQDPPKESRSRNAGPGTAAAARGKPISLHPRNPHYFLFRGQPTVLVTSAEHYGAVINREFDYHTYLRALHADGLNLTRVFTGAYREPYWGPADQNTLAPRPGRFLAPWARSRTPGYQGGGNKFDLDRWDQAYFRRLRDFVQIAGRLGIVVEVVFFSKMYDDRNWQLSPLHVQNNVNGIGKGPWLQFSSLEDRALVARQEALIRKVVRELRSFDNVYCELCNEPDAPIREGQPQGLLQHLAQPRPWLNHLAATTAAAQAGFPTRQLIAVQDPLMCDSPAVSVYNFHYANLDVRVGTMGAMQGLEQFYSRNKPLVFDETETDRPAAVTRREAWAFLLSGGAGYNHLDSSFMRDDETGSGRAQWNGKRHDYRPLRRQLGFLKRFLESVEFVRLRPAREEVVQAAPAGVEPYVLADPGRTYALYLSLNGEGKQRGAGPLVIRAPAGRYRAEWLSPETGRLVQRVEAVAGEGSVTLAVPAFTPDLALRLERSTGSAGTTSRSRAGQRTGGLPA